MLEGSVISNALCSCPGFLQCRTPLLQVDVTAAEAVLPDDQKQAQGPVSKAGAANHITAALKQLGGQAAMKTDPWAEIKTGPLRIKPHKAQNTAVQVGASRCLSKGQQGWGSLQHVCRCSA